jgi:hypothetical protein
LPLGGSDLVRANVTQRLKRWAIQNQLSCQLFIRSAGF